MSDTPRLAAAIASNATFTALRVLVQTAAGLAVSVVLARTLGPHEFGTYRLALSVVWVLEFATVLAFPSATTKFVAELSARRGAGAVAAVVRFFLGRATLCYVLVAVPFLALSPAVARFYRDDRLVPLLVLGGLSVLPGIWTGILHAGLRGLQRFPALSLFALVHAVVNLAAIVLILSHGGGLQALFALLVGLNLLSLGMVLVAMRHHLAAGRTGAIEAEPRRRMIRYAVVMGAANAANLLLSERVEVFFLGRFWNPAEVGFYGLAVSLALYARRLAPTALDEALFPVLAQLEGARERWDVANAWLHATRYMAMLGLPLVVGGALAAEPAITVFFGPAYLPAAPAFAVLLSAAGVVAMAHPAGSVILSQERHTFLLRGTIAAGLGSILIDLVLIPPFGATGAAVANGIVLVVWSMAQIAFVAASLRARLPAGNIARALAATVLAFLPALAARQLTAAPPALRLTAVVLAFAVLYPLALALTGALLGDDVERLRAVVDRLPRPARPALRRALGVLTRWA
jgi:O-antigen/teichoic acid export membrane protein